MLGVSVPLGSATGAASAVARKAETNTRTEAFIFNVWDFSQPVVELEISET
jgi:hypothetical protein